MNKILVTILLFLMVFNIFGFLNIEPASAIDESLMYKVRNAIVLGQQFLDRSYKETNGGQWGAIAEYPTTNPIGYKVHETGSKHTAGDGDMQGNDANNPSLWYYYFDKTSDPWQFVEPQKRDFLYIIDAGFEEADRIDSIWGNQYAQDDDNEPCVTIEFESNQLLKNPSVEFRKWKLGKDTFIDNDDPWDWIKYTTGNAVARMGFLQSGSPTTPGGGGSHTGYYTLVLDPNSGHAEFYQWVENIKPNTVYYVSFAFYGKILGDDDLTIGLQWFDANGNQVGSGEYKDCPSGDWTGLGWQFFNSTTFQTPANTAKAKFRVMMDSYGTDAGSWAYADTMYFSENNAVISSSRTSFQIYDYLGTRTVDMYLDNQLVEQNVNTTWLSVKVNPRPYYTSVKQTFQSMRTAIRHEDILGHNYQKYSSDTSDWSTKANKFKALRDYYGLWSTASFATYDWYEPMYRTTATYPDDWYWSNVYRGTDYPGMYEYHTIYDYKYGDTDYLYHPYGTSPFRDVNHHPYRSKVLINPRYFMEGFPSPVDWAVQAGHKYHPISLSMIAMHILDKYNDPNYHFNYWGMGDATPLGLVLGPSYGPSPVGYILQYWTQYGILYPTSLNPGIYTATNQALCLAVLSELGYGYGYSTARTYADQLATIICDIQWGNPDSTGKPKHWGLSEQWGWVNRPDCTGGFIICYGHGSGYYATQNQYWIDMLADSFYGMPKETYSFLPVNQESQLCVRALEIYDWYKFKKNGATNSGRFPRLTISEDINGDGKVDTLDLALVSKAYGSVPGDSNWNPLCDIDLNKVINILDQSKVNQHYGRTSD